MMDMCHFRIEIYINQLPCEVVFNMFGYSKQEDINFFSNSSFPACSGNIKVFIFISQSCGGSDS